MTPIPQTLLQPNPHRIGLYNLLVAAADRLSQPWRRGAAKGGIHHFYTFLVRSDGFQPALAYADSIGQVVVLVPTTTAAERDELETRGFLREAAFGWPGTWYQRALQLDFETHSSGQPAHVYDELLAVLALLADYVPAPATPGTGAPPAQYL